ncbi:DUF11 domain-containing protein [Polaribacter sp. IC073]|uniref:DUF11 domain-containing protein n=1 Tax=Polaribacter sp. IC073 TaxID=2508540 RepID=UPI0011BD7296|nr:DUF11 domain-containing protein [Polaribacter sp. IC073]TXD50135.1 DUF11 domain-containing protein [Polaribacter sp. IC073]
MFLLLPNNYETLMKIEIHTIFNYQNKISKRKLLSVIFALAVFTNLFADGTKQVMPDANNGVAMYITDNGQYGPHLNSSPSQRLQFRILDHTTENLYFGLNPRQRNGSPLVLSTNLYYLIKNAAGNSVAGPFKFNTTDGSPGYISNYNQAVAGPNINNAVPTGYNPLSFNPSSNGDYYIEIYKSNDSGATRTVDGPDVVIPYFDFTVSDTSNNRTEGRVFSQKWGFITYNPATFVPAIGFDFKGKFFGYTDDKIIVTVEFQEGFRPFGYLLSMNKFGIVNDDNDPANVWTATRKSISYGGSTGNSIPNLLNGYPVFITEPDAAAFPIGVPVPPVSIGRIFGCPGNYLITVKTVEAGDVDITLDLNGVIGFQENTRDIIVQAFNQPKGNIVIPWDGIDGEGNPVLGNTTTSATLTSLRGRTSVPMIDAELNPNGLVINALSPVLSNRRMFWDDSGIVTTPNNNTIGGLNKSNAEDGQLGPTHKWNGDNPPGDNLENNPAPSGSKGSSTGSTLDDYGNERVLNTWFYGEEVTSPNASVSVPNCDVDNDTYSDNVDLDDDNDGILDTVELGSFDPDGDHDGDTIPDYIDPQFPGFIDTNSDGVDDRFDLDLDGIMNHWDLDSDGDGIPDNVEAQSTTGFVAANTAVNGDGVPVNFAGGIAPVNTDGDVNADYLDTDSDGDGILDTTEAGITLADKDTDNDGLDDATDATSGPEDVDGNITPSALPDEDNDLGIAGGDVDYRDNTDNDYDNDGVPDATDVDDDNDGILDTVEGFCTQLENFSGGNGGSIKNFTVNGAIRIQIDLTFIDDAVGVSINDRGIHNSIIGFESSSVNALPANFSSDNAYINTPWIANNNGLPRVRIVVENDGNVKLLGTRTTNSTSLESMKMSDGSSFNSIIFKNIGSNSFVIQNPDGNGPDAIEGVASIVSGCDDDNDGNPNYLDTDSDNDGCSDALEGAGNIQFNQLTVLAGGSNGGSSNNLGTTSDADGNPIVNNVGFEQATTAAVKDLNNKDACLIDLSTTKTVDKAVLKKGQIVIFTIQLKNDGSLNATGVKVKDILPAGLTYSSVGSITPTNTTYTPGTGIWDLSSLTIAENQIIELKIAAIVNTIRAIITNKTEIFITVETDKDSIPNSSN